MSCEAGVRKYGPRKVQHVECVFETVKTGARKLKTGFLYHACSPLKCDPVTGIYEPVTDPADECSAWMICGEDLRNHPADYCSVGVLLQGCVNMNCVHWPCDADGEPLFTAEDIELWRSKKNCCITLEWTVCGVPECPADKVEEKNLDPKLQQVAAQAAKAKTSTRVRSSKKKAGSQRKAS
jgi:hypothetical protein